MNLRDQLDEIESMIDDYLGLAELMGRDVKLKPGESTTIASFAIVIERMLDVANEQARGERLEQE